MQRRPHWDRILKGYRVLTLRDNQAYLAKGGTVYRTQDGGRALEGVGVYVPPFYERCASTVRITARLLRSGLADLHIFPDGSTVAIANGFVVRMAPGQSRFHPVFRIPRGRRPIGTLSLPGRNLLYMGEYFSNPHRDEVHLYASEDGGRRFEICHTYARGSIRHVHGLVWDPYRRGIWVLTGDYGKEVKIQFTSDGFASLETVLSGRQLYRTAHVVPMRSGIALATDSETEQNFVSMVSYPELRYETLYPMKGSCLYTTRVGEWTFFSTMVEPGTGIQTPYSSLVATRDFSDFREYDRWKKDWWPARLFQYGNLCLPSGDGSGQHLFLTGQAVKGLDGSTAVFRLPEERKWV